MFDNCYFVQNFILVKLCFLFQQARAEQEEEFISNTLLKKIQSLKKEKEALAMNYEQEEEFLTNDLSRKLHQVCVDGKIIAWSYSAESEKVVMTGESLQHKII